MKKTIKRIGLSLATLAILTTSSHALFGIGDIVFDPIQTLKAVGEYAEEARRWKKHLKEWEADYKAITKFRLDATILNKFTELNNLLEKYGLDMGDLDLDNPKSQIGVYAKQLFDSYTIFDDCNYDYMTRDQKRICRNNMLRNSKQMATVSKLRDSVKKYVKKLNKLNAKLAKSKDIKSSQDITAGIQSTISSMNALKIQYEMMMIRDDAEQQMEQRQKEQIAKEKRQNSSSFNHQSFL